jgi:hypothetical protein
MASSHVSGMVSITKRVEETSTLFVIYKSVLLLNDFLAALAVVNSHQMIFAFI